MLIEQVYKVFGDNLPATRSEYSAVVAKPVTMLTITKEFKNWKSFVLAYNTYAIMKRIEKSKAVIDV